MCLNCLRFVRPENICTESDFFSLIERIKPVVSAGFLKIVQTTTSIEEIREGESIGDTYYMVVQCSKCDREFHLNVDLYHGRGYWK